jgi:hypothetical protein
MELHMLTGCAKEELSQLAETLSCDEIAQLVAWTSEKEDAIRYPAFLLLQHRAEAHADVYAYWDTFYQKLGSDNAYQRIIGLQMIACNARWDAQDRMETAIARYLSFCDDEKPVVVRLCIQGLCNIVRYKANLEEPILQKLLGIDLLTRKDTQRRLVLKDILSVLPLIKSKDLQIAIRGYYMQALTGSLLDRKEKTALKDLVEDHA